MAPTKNNNHSSSNRNGEAVGRQANVLASCYVVDSSSRLTGFHYSTTGAGGTFFPLYYKHITARVFSNSSLEYILTLVQGLSGFPEVLGSPSGYPSPPSSPPLAALTSANELALISKNSPDKKRDFEGRRRSRKEGAAYTIREECERLFCETMKTVFLGEEGNATINGSIVMGGDAHSPPDERVDVYNGFFANKKRQPVDAWLEIWDYAGGCSFRGYVGGSGDEKSLFAFFDSAVIGRDLKQALMALIELAEEVFALSQVVICLDRSVPEADSNAFMKSLRWVGFELIALDMWANALDVTSDKWLFMGMEI